MSGRVRVAIAGVGLETNIASMRRIGLRPFYAGLCAAVMMAGVSYGLITLFGIATRNGIMMIAHIRSVHEQGESNLRAAVIRGASERVAPILMTALAAGLALVPIALGMGKPGSEIQAPMAIVIFFGLLTSTALNMVVVPAAYYRFGTPR